MSSNAPDGERIRVIVVDDQQITREGLVALLGLMADIEVIADAGDGATVSLLRTAREALTNAAKHAPGAPVAVVLTYHATLVRLAVSNSGPALPAIPSAGVSGYGLTGMRERLALVGGTLVAGPRADGDGWLVVAEIGES